MTPPPPPHNPIPNEIHSGSHKVSGTSEQLGMRPRCEPTICTMPTNVYGRVSSAWVFLAIGTGNLGTVDPRRSWGLKDTMGFA